MVSSLLSKFSLSSCTRLTTPVARHSGFGPGGRDRPVQVLQRVRVSGPEELRLPDPRKERNKNVLKHRRKKTALGIYEVYIVLNVTDPKWRVHVVSHDVWDSEELDTGPDEERAPRPRP